MDPANLDKGTEKCFYVDYTNMPKVLKKGDTIYIDDGLVSLRATEIGENYIDTVVENSGAVSNHKGVNLPNVDVDLPALSKKDKGDLTFGVQQNVDMPVSSPAPAII